MAKPRIDLVGASVALLASLVALLLVQLRENENTLQYREQVGFIWESPFGDFLILFALWLAVLASLVLVAAALFGRASSRPDPARQYQAAVEMAWADKELNETEKRWLGRLEGELGLSRDRAEQIERKVMMGRVRGDIASPEDKSVLQYRAAVKMAWADGELNEAEAGRLGALAREFGLSQEKAGDVERGIMRDVKENVIDYGPEEDPTFREDGLGRYRVAVEMAWADEKLNQEEKDRLSALENELGLSWGEAADTEREVMGGTKEEIETYKEPDIPPPPPPDDEAWMKLVEECVEVVEEFDRNMAAFDPPRQELADHVILRLGEVLERSGVDVISDDEVFDSGRHKQDRASSPTGSGSTVVETLSPGFAVGRRVLRRARVRVE